MKKVLAYVSLFVLSSPLFAVLSPYWDSVQQINTIMNDFSVSDKMTTPIVEIKKVENLIYKVKTEALTVKVFLREDFPEALGQTTYSVVSVEEVHL